MSALNSVTFSAIFTKLGLSPDDGNRRVLAVLAFLRARQADAAVCHPVADRQRRPGTDSFPAGRD